MSDRIDELGSLARSLAHRLHLRLTEAAGAGYMMPDAQVTALTDAINELATIAREAEARALKAEAMCERLAMLWQTSGGSDSCGRCPACPCVPDEGKPLQQGASCHASILAAAREAVRQGER